MSTPNKRKDVPSTQEPMEDALEKNCDAYLQLNPDKDSEFHMDEVMDEMDEMYRARMGDKYDGAIFRYKPVDPDTLPFSF